ncbi:MAG TPA: hypothetical protein PK024_07415 [Methanospirillum sp.]|uniref:hypothetical protein n=1 Tax=Methanospirillum sp. TaxID=45200 RepID=UPI002B731B70|nr:hypothetical protein [Methanospirillum sp.]HOJ96643.1 hypothetical protein [Methanospirillum sp.]HOL40682.1 hypothetical protein [Methanospirillum sp.]HPP79178.1 hypothetical protein [Methanospirillum sp.]
MENETREPFYCIACGYVSPVYQRRCPSCGIVDRFCTERQYAELMMRYLHHPIRKYRIFSLRTIKRLKWKEAMPELLERARIERDLELKAEVQRTIEALTIYHNRSDARSASGMKRETSMYTLRDETKCKIIPIRPVLRRKGHSHLRPGRRI